VEQLIVWAHIEAVQIVFKKAEKIMKFYVDSEDLEKQLEYLLRPSDPRSRQFYMLSKLHKSADRWTTTNKRPPGRPIVSDCGSESKRVAAFIDSILNPWAICHPAYIKNIHTISWITSRMYLFPRDCILITLDVEVCIQTSATPKGTQSG